MPSTPTSNKVWTSEGVQLSVGEYLFPEYFLAFMLVNVTNITIKLVNIIAPIFDLGLELKKTKAKVSEEVSCAAVAILNKSCILYINISFIWCFKNK